MLTRAPAPTTMTASLPIGFHQLRFAPERRAFLAGRCLCADEFRAVELPDEQPDFARAGAFLTLAAAVADEAPAVFTVAARPAYDEGSVARWLAQLCVRDELEHGRITPCRLGALPGVTCEVVQDPGAGGARGRIVLLEDGGRLFKLTALAPDTLWEKYAARFGVMLQSFELLDVRGTKCPLTMAQKRTLSPPVRPVLLTREEWDELVLDRDAASVEALGELPSHWPVPARGAAPEVVAADPVAHLALVVAPAIEGTVRLPFGWRAFDDGSRTIVTDPLGAVRIVLEEIAHDGRTLHQLTEDFAAGSFAVRRLRASTSLLFDDIVGVEVQGQAGDEPRVDRAFLLRDVGRPGCVLAASIEAARPDMRRARNLAGEMLAGFESAHAAIAG